MVRLFLLAGASLAAAASAAAADRSYLGAWTIKSAVAAPWADPAHPPDAAERASLTGKTVRLSPRAISGPDPFSCHGPHYAIKSYTPDMLFQGELGELQDAHPKTSAASLAASLGFTGKTIRTLETGCEIDWHFVDPHTVEIGLDDWVFTLKGP